MCSAVCCTVCCAVYSVVCCVVSHLEIFFPYASSVHTFFIIEDHLHMEQSEGAGNRRVS